MDYKIGDKVLIYEIKLDFIKNTTEKSKQEYNIIGVNDYKLCINDNSFTSLKYKKLYKGDKDKLFGDIFIVDMTDIDFIDYIIGKLYTTQTNDKIAYKTIKKELKKYIYKKHGRYSGAIELLNLIED